MRKLMLAGALIGSVGMASVADVAGAQPYYYHHHRYYHHYYRSDYGHHTYYRNCSYERHRAGAIGAVTGAVGGGIIGGAIGHGRAGPTLLGAGAGALTGNAIARNSHRC
jgi:outer membrane lipoprotein SlyB